MQRVIAPSQMSGEGLARAYAGADLADANRRFMALFEQRFPEFDGGLVLDVGCGPGDITIRFAHRYVEATIHGLDGSGAMLRYAQHALAHAPDLRTRVRFVQGVLPHAVLPRRQYHAIISNNLLHRLDEPSVLWGALPTAGRPGALICIMDLRRPESVARAEEIVERYSGGQPENLKRDFYNSLLAAFVEDEVREQLAAAELPLVVETCNDLHLLVWGRLPG